MSSSSPQLLLDGQVGAQRRALHGRHTCAGVSGMSAWRMPYGFSASTTALTTAAGDPTVADSPTPLRRWGGAATA
jgi:hypothetical protein